jgi:secreted PhoX family phosphatase
VRGGLASFAAAMMSRTLPGCGSDDGADAGLDGGMPLDTGAPMLDAPMIDAGPWPVRDIPPPPALRSLIADIGPLGDPDASGLRVPAGFTARVIARTGTMVAGSSYEWHLLPDGGATFATEDGGWIYVSNAEVPLRGGVGAIRFSPTGEIRDAYRILDRTDVNCAGGKTPWHTWLSCEEVNTGLVYECDPWGEREAIARPALGVFKHEAVAVDSVRGHLYLTEDESDGRFYRFTPGGMLGDRPDLTSGRLEMAAVDGAGAVTWLEVPDPGRVAGIPTRQQVPASTAFRGGEGIWYHDGAIYFATKSDNRVWRYDVAAEELTVLYDAATAPDPQLTGVDNLTVSCCGDVLVAEDGGSMEVVAILPDGELKPLLQVIGQDLSEITGPAFDPSGTRLYFSSQRSPESGMTWEITGPFHEPA